MGRPQFAASGTNKSGEKVAVSDRPDVKESDQTQSGSVASGATESVDVFAPTDTIWRVVAFKTIINADADATSGTHKLRIDAFGIQYLSGKSNHSSSIVFNKGRWENADSNQAPSGNVEQQAQMRALRADEDSAITLAYDNNTDAAQENNRQHKLIVEEFTL